MTKTANSSKAANKSAQDYCAVGVGYREIGIAAVAAALRCQRMAAPEDERRCVDSSDWRSDRLP